jgi:predicted kinase
MSPTLIIFGGLPATGKTTIALELAHQMGAVYLRIDSIEQAIRDSKAIDGSIDDAGYRVAYAVAEDNLRLGQTVIADSVNPLQLTRDAWIGAADRAGAVAIEVEIICSDREQHQRQELMPFVGKYVRASGTVFERTGTHAIVITEIKEMKEIHLMIDGQ